MQQKTTQRAGLSRMARAGLVWWFALLLCAASFWPAAALAAPSPFCGPFNISVAHGGSFTIDASACDGPADFGIGFVETPPTHGIATVNTLGQTVTYAHFGGADNATSDTFIFDDGNNNDVTVNVTIGPASSITISPGTLSLTAGVIFSQQLSAAGGTAPYVWTLDSGTLPPGLTLTPGGLIAGLPSARGNHTFTVRATDAAAQSATKSYAVTVANPTLTLSPASPSAGVIGVPYVVTFLPAGGIAPYALAFENGTLPPGLSLSGAVLSGTPSALGTYTFGIRVTDSSTGPGSYFEVESVTLTITSPPTITVNPATLPAATAGVAYSQSISGSGGATPYAYTLSAGALPAGLSLNAVSGAITGTPTVGGSFNFTITATDANSFTGARAYTLTVNAPTITLAPTSLPAANVAAAYSQAISASGGAAPYTYALSAGALPAGLSLSAGGAITGTPTAGGSFNFTITATDANSFTGARAYTLTVNAPTITLAPASLPAGNVAAAYSQAISASGGTAPYTYALSAGALPAGLSLSAGGAITGTPTAGGSFNFTITSTDSSTGSGPYSGSRAYSLTINAATVALPATTLLDGTVGTAYAATINPASGGIAPYAYAVTAGGLPAGVSLSSAGALSGTPTASGTFNFTITATDNSTGTGPYTGSRAYSLIIQQAMPVANPVSATVGYGSGANAIPLNITGSAATAVAVATPALHGSAIASGTAITYQPNAGYAGPDNFTYTASNGAGTSVAATVTVTVGNPTIAVTASASLTAQVGVAYAQTFTWSGGASPYSGYAVTGLPAGLSITATSADSVTVSGTPTVAGAFTLNASATDSSTGTGPFPQAQAFVLTVNAPTLVMAPGPGTLTLAYGVAYSQSLVASGGTGPYSYALSAGALPPGIAFTSAGLLSGTPTAPGSYPVSIRATDSSTGVGAPYAITNNYVLQVGAVAVAVNPASLPNPVTSIAYSQSLSASGGIAPYAFAVSGGSLPPGLAFTSAGVLSGTPTASGAFSFTISAQDANGQSGARVYSVNVAVPALSMAPSSLPAGNVGVAYGQVFSTSGGIAPYSYALVGGTLPPGIAFTSAGELSGTPTAAGTFNFAIRSSDSSGGGAATVTVNYALVIAAPTIALAPSSLPGGIVGTAYGASLSASGGTAPYAYALSAGSLPPGVSFTAAGAFAGMPTGAGSYSFTITATDSLGFSASQAYVIAIVDAVPVAVNDSAATIAQQPVSIAVTGNDSGVISTIAIATAPAHGSATVSGLSIVYTPASGYFGADALTYSAIGPGGSSAPATVAITVTALPVPQGPAQTVTTLAGQPVTIDATVGASGGPFTGVTLVTAPSTGSAVVTGTSIVYTPPADASGPVAVVYTLHNAYGASAPITATVTVNPLPVAVSRRVSAVAGAAVAIDLTTGASGGPFTGATLVSLSPAASGTAAIVRNGATYQLTFTPAAAFAGTATATFTLDNAFATSAPATIDIDVAARPDPTRDAEVLGVLGAQVSATRRFATVQIGNFQQRMENMHGGADRDARFRNGLTFVIDPRCREDARRKSASDCLRDETAPVAAPATADSGAAYTIWSGGSISSGDRDGSLGRSGFNFETSGVSLGADYRINRAFALGGGIGYGRDDSDIGGNGSRSDADSRTIALYGSYHPGEVFFVDGLFGYQWLSFDTRRYIAANAGQVRGDRDGKQWFASLSLGGDYRRDRLHVSPYTRIDVARATLDGYVEQGDAIYALRYQEQGVDTSTASLGLRLDYRYPVSLGTFSPQLRLEYQHDFEGDSSVTMGYADLPGGPFYRTQVQGLERNRFVFGIGATLHTARDLTLRLEYRGLFGSGDATDHGIGLNLEKNY